MSMNGSQIARCNNAISAARARLPAQGDGFTLLPSREERATDAAWDTLEAIEGVYRYWLDSAEPASEEIVAQIVLNAGGLTPGFVDTLAEGPLTLGDAIGDRAGEIMDSAGTVLKVVIVIAAIGAVIYLLSGVKTAGRVLALAKG